MEKHGVSFQRASLFLIHGRPVSVPSKLAGRDERLAFLNGDTLKIISKRYGASEQIISAHPQTGSDYDKEIEKLGFKKNSLKNEECASWKKLDAEQCKNAAPVREKIKLEVQERKRDIKRRVDLTNEAKSSLLAALDETRSEREKAAARSNLNDDAAQRRALAAALRQSFEHVSGQYLEEPKTDFNASVTHQPPRKPSYKTSLSAGALIAAEAKKQNAARRDTQKAELATDQQAAQSLRADRPAQHALDAALAARTALQDAAREKAQQAQAAAQVKSAQTHEALDKALAARRAEGEAAAKANEAKNTQIAETRQAERQTETRPPAPEISLGPAHDPPAATFSAAENPPPPPPAPVIDPNIAPSAATTSHAVPSASIASNVSAQPAAAQPNAAPAAAPASPAFNQAASGHGRQL